MTLLNILGILMLIYSIVGIVLSFIKINRNDSYTKKDDRGYKEPAPILLPFRIPALFIKWLRLQNRKKKL